MCTGAEIATDFWLSSHSIDEMNTMHVFVLGDKYVSNYIDHTREINGEG